MNDYFDELIYDLEYDITTGKEKNFEKINTVKDKNDNIKESTIENSISLKIRWQKMV